jgi:hypothetical protein
MEEVQSPEARLSMSSIWVCGWVPAGSLRAWASGQFGNHVAQLMDLLLAGDVAGRSAWILEVLLAAHHLPEAVRVRSDGVPDMDGERQAAAARVVVEGGSPGRPAVSGGSYIGMEFAQMYRHFGFRVTTRA